jgi:hypothetical protein
MGGSSCLPCRIGVSKDWRKVIFRPLPNHTDKGALREQALRFVPKGGVMKETPTILVVDDDPSTLELVREILSPPTG